MTLAKSLTAVPRGEGYLSAAKMVPAVSAINSAIARANIILHLLPKDFIFTNYQKTSLILLFNYGANITSYLEKARHRSLYYSILFKNFLSCDSKLGGYVVMSLRGRVTTEAISYLIYIIEIATTPERRLAMTNEDCYTVSSRL